MPASKAIQAAKNEAEPEKAQDIEFEFDGHKYVIEADAFNDIEIAELVEDEKHLSVIRQVLGREQWDAWKSRERDKSESGRVTGDVAVSFIEAVFEAAGQGN